MSQLQTRRGLFHDDRVYGHLTLQNFAMTMNRTMVWYNMVDRRGEILADFINGGLMKTSKKDDVIEFIERRFKKDCDWTTGNCYWFARLLCDRFNELRIYYVPCEGHFVAGDGIAFFDATGEYDLPLTWMIYEFESLRETDEPWYNRLVKECIL